MPKRNALFLSRLAPVVMAGLVVLASCEGPGETSPDPGPPDVLLRVGTLVVREADLERRIREHHAGRTDEETREAALEELARRAQFAQAALDAGLADDPLVRDEFSRLLAARLRETALRPRLEEAADIPEERLRARYEARLESYQAPEKRRVAVLWLDPGPDPDRTRRYEEKLAKARAFVLQDRDLREHPEKGFSVLGVDHSQHQASRFRGGIIGWLQAGGGADPWTRAVAEIASGLQKNGEVSEVVTRTEGVFLVRVMEIRPAVTRSFQSVLPELERTERARVRRELEAAFDEEITSRYPVHRADR